MASKPPHASAASSHYAEVAEYFIRGEFSLFILFFILQTFEQATKLKEDKNKGPFLGGAVILHQDLFPIEWVNETGLTALGITFFAYQLETTNKTWSAAKEKLQVFCDRSDNRKALSFGDRGWGGVQVKVSDFLYLDMFLSLEYGEPGTFAGIKKYCTAFQKTGASFSGY